MLLHSLQDESCRLSQYRTQMYFRTLELVWVPRKCAQIFLEKDLTPDWEMHFKPIEKLFLKTLLTRPPTTVRQFNQLYIVQYNYI